MVTQWCLATRQWVDSAQRQLSTLGAARGIGGHVPEQQQRLSLGVERIAGRAKHELIVEFIRVKEIINTSNAFHHVHAICARLSNVR